LEDPSLVWLKEAEASFFNLFVLENGRRKMLSSKSVDAYFYLLSEALRERLTVTFDFNVLFLDSTFMSLVLDEGFEKASDFLGPQDPFSFRLMLIPYFFENAWVLIALDTNYLASSRFSKLMYFGLGKENRIPGFMSRLRSFLYFDFSRRHSNGENNRTPGHIFSSKFRNINSIESYSDIFVCHSARALLRGEDISAFLDKSVSTLKDILVSDFSIHSESGPKRLASVLFDSTDFLGKIKI
jgi:hypothetical protein